MVRRNMNRTGVKPAFQGRLQGVAGDARAEAEDFDDRGAPGGGRPGGLARSGMFAHETAGAIGNACERDASA